MFYRFPAMRGIQANTEYFVCMIHLGILPKIFMDDSSDTLPEFRAQRKLNEKRVPEIQNYILNIQYQNLHYVLLIQNLQ